MHSRPRLLMAGCDPLRERGVSHVPRAVVRGFTQELEAQSSLLGKDAHLFLNTCRTVTPNSDVSGNTGLLNSVMKRMGSRQGCGGHRGWGCLPL